MIEPFSLVERFLVSYCVELYLSVHTLYSGVPVLPFMSDDNSQSDFESEKSNYCCTKIDSH